MADLGRLSGYSASGRCNLRNPYFRIKFDRLAVVA